MISAILGTKQETVQKFTQTGQRIPVTRILAGPCVVVQVKRDEKDNYHALQLGWGEKKIAKTKKPLQGHFKRAKLKKMPFYLREIRVEKEVAEAVKPGEPVKVSQVFQTGDEVRATGWSKGKGFTGVVKRWGFAGGPKTHGQSDRLRAPGSIGQTTRIGRVFKGKKMPGRSGGQKVTVKSLTVMAIADDDNNLWLKGLVPGPRGGLLVIKKTGKVKNFVPLAVKNKKD